MHETDAKLTRNRAYNLRSFINFQQFIYEPLLLVEFASRNIKIELQSL